MRSRFAPWVLVVLSLAGWMATTVYRYLLDTSGVPRPGDDSSALYVVVGVAMAVVAVTGGIIASRQPRNAIGWIFVLTSLVVAVKSGSGAYVELGHYAHHDALPALRLTAWFSDWIWIFGIGPFATLVFLLFPTGKPPSPRWRFVAWLAGFAVVGSAISVAFHRGHLDQFRYYANPLGAPKPLSPIVDLFGLGFALLVVSIALSVASLVFRVRSGDAIVREQVKWIAYAGSFLVVGFAYSVYATNFTVVPAVGVFAPIAGIAVAAAVAIQRYRLFDIDRLISRTLSYAVVSATLVVIFAIVVIVPTLVFQGRRAPDYLIAIATLSVAALFRPVRRRVQRVVDRRFNRTTFDVQRTIETFATRLRQHVDLDALETEIRTVVSSTMHPQHVSLWVREDARR